MQVKHGVDSFNRIIFIGISPLLSWLFIFVFIFVSRPSLTVGLLRIEYHSVFG